MRTQKILTIDCGIGRRGNNELYADFASRVDTALRDQLNVIQDNHIDWDLLSVVPAGSNFPSGWFLTTWELDDDRLQNADDTASIDVSDEPRPPVLLNFGDTIEVNGVLFKLTQFGQDRDEGAMVSFRPVGELQDEDGPVDFDSLREPPRVFTRQTPLRGDYSLHRHGYPRR